MASGLLLLLTGMNIVFLQCMPSGSRNTASSAPSKQHAFARKLFSFITILNLVGHISITLWMGVPADIFRGGGRQFAQLTRKLPDLFCN